jgi:hypothetical protein
VESVLKLPAEVGFSRVNGSSVNEGFIYFISLMNPHVGRHEDFFMIDRQGGEGSWLFQKHENKN